MNPRAHAHSHSHPQHPHPHSYPPPYPHPYPPHAGSHYPAPAPPGAPIYGAYPVPYQGGGANGIGPPPPKTKRQVLRETRNVGNLIHSFKRRWFLALFLGMLAATAGAVYAWWAAPAPRYASTAIINIRPPAAKSAFETNAVPVSAAEFMEAQLLLLKSDPVLRKAIDSPGILELASLETVDDPVGWLEPRIHTNTADQTLRVAVEAPAEDDARKLVNALIDAFLDSAESSERGKRLERQNQLKETLEESKKSLEGRRSQISKIYDAIGARDKSGIAVKMDSAQNRLDEMERQLFETQTKVRQAKIELKAADIRVKAAAALSRAATAADRANYTKLFNDAVEDLLAKDRQAETIRSRIAFIKSGIEDLRRVVRQKNNDPLIRKREDALAEAEKQYESYQRTVRKKVSDDLQAKLASSSPSASAVNSAKSALAEIQQRVRGLEETEEFCITKREQLQREQNALMTQVRELDLLQENMAVLQNSETQLLEQLEATKREMDDPVRVRLEHRGSPSRLITNPKRKWLLAAALGSACMAVTVLSVILLESRTKRVYSMENVSETLGFPIVGMVPKLPRAAERGSKRSAKQDLFAAILRDSIDEIRTQVLHRCRPGKLHVILMTSAMPREGKSTLCVSLAESLAKSGRRTLIIDCDLRRPILHLTLGLPIYPGISEFLKERAGLSDVAQPSGIPNLWVATAGGCRAEGMLALDRLTEVAAQAQHHFDFVLIDSAPVLPVPDTLVVSKCADYALFVIMRNSSRMSAVYDAYQRLQGFGIPILGAIVNGVQLDRGYGYGYGYGYASSGGEAENG